MTLVEDKSMLSAQIENLRIMARLVREYEYKEIRRELRDAADTIEHLRVMAQDVMPLRELVGDMYGYAANREMELCNACTEADGDYADCAACDAYDGACGIAKRRFEELYKGRMKALGIEVD